MPEELNKAEELTVKVHDQLFPAIYKKTISQFIDKTLQRVDSYLLGRMPIADAFIAWSDITPNYMLHGRAANLLNMNFNRSKFLLLSIFAVFTLFIPEFYFFYKHYKKPRSV